MEHIGIDVHKRESQICILTAEGEISERRIQSTREKFTALFKARARARVLLEATTESEWVAQMIERLGHEVIVADPNYAPMYPERRRRVKTDRRDARMLAEAARLGSYRPAHRVSAEQRQVRRQLLGRDLLVRSRGRTIALMRALVRSEGLRVRSGDADQFGTYVRALELPDELQMALRPLLALWTHLTEQLATADAQLAATAAANPVVQRLTTAPGVGPVMRRRLSRPSMRPDALAAPIRSKATSVWCPVKTAPRTATAGATLPRHRQSADALVVGASRVGGAAVPPGRRRGPASLGGATRQTPRPTHRHRGGRAPVGGDAVCDVAGQHHV